MTEQAWLVNAYYDGSFNPLGDPHDNHGETYGDLATVLGDGNIWTGAVLCSNTAPDNPAPSITAFRWRWEALEERFEGLPQTTPLTVTATIRSNRQFFPPDDPNYPTYQDLEPQYIHIGAAADTVEIYEPGGYPFTYAGGTAYQTLTPVCDVSWDPFPSDWRDKVMTEVGAVITGTLLLAPGYTWPEVLTPEYFFFTSTDYAGAHQEMLLSEVALSANTEPEIGTWSLSGNVGESRIAWL